MIVIFIRKTSFYPLDLPREQCTFEGLESHARSNPGTMRVEDMKGNCLWQPPEQERRKLQYE